MRPSWTSVAVLPTSASLARKRSRSDELGGNRYLADVRHLDVPPEHIVVTDGIRCTGPTLTMAMKAAAAAARTNEPKRLQDLADLARLIVALPGIGTAELEPIWTAVGACPVRALCSRRSGAARASRPRRTRTASIKGARANARPFDLPRRASPQLPPANEQFTSSNPSAQSFCPSHRTLAGTASPLGQSMK